jgi:hypothetical protein
MRIMSEAVNPYHALKEIGLDRHRLLGEGEKKIAHMSMKIQEHELRHLEREELSKMAIPMRVETEHARHHLVSDELCEK